MNCSTHTSDHLLTVVGRLFLMIGALSLLSACGRSDAQKQFDRLVVQPLSLRDMVREPTSNAEPVRALEALDPEVVASPIVKLGGVLFHDNRLSGDGTLSCSSCHDIQTGGDDSRPTSVGIRGQIGPINAPTVLNSGHNFRQFWDGRAESLTAQALGPVANPIEMGALWPDVVAALSEDKAMVGMFKKAFDTEEITALRVAEAIAAFERTLITPSPFDQYLAGDRRAISQEAVEGYALFKDYGCSSCHQGVNFGGNLYQHFGAFQSIDLGESGDRSTLANGEPAPLFKVPTLRNIAKTAPYFHLGTVNNLDAAVRVMGSAQLGRVLSAKDVKLIVAFLESLTGEVPSHARSGFQVSSSE